MPLLPRRLLLPLLVAVLAGCGSAPPSAVPSASPVAAGSVPATTPASTKAPVVDAMATCRAFIGDGGETSLIMRIPTAINSIAAAGMNPSSSQISTMLTINDELNDLIQSAPTSMAPSLRAAQLPFQQVADSHNSGGRAVLNTGGVRDAAYAMMSACADVGYRVGS